MVETYSVQSTFTARDELTAVLERQAAAAREVGEAMRRATGTGVDAFAKLASAAKTSFSSIADVVSRLDGALDRLGGETTDTATKFRAAGAGMASGLDAPLRAVAKLQASIDRVGATPIRLRTTGDLNAIGKATSAAANRNAVGGNNALNIPAVPPFAQRYYNVHTGKVPPVPPGGTPGGPWSPGSGGSGGPRGGSGGHAGGFDLLMGGMMAGYIGDSLADALKDPIQQAAGLQNARMALQRQLGSSPTATADYATLTSAAAAVTKAFPSSTLTANLKAAGDLYSVIGSAPEAAALLNPVAQVTIASNAINPGKVPDAYTALRSAEMLGYTVDPRTGKMSPQRAQSYLDILEAAQISTQGRVNPQSMLGFAQQAGLAGKNLTPQGLRMMVPVINEVGGQRAGTALSSISNQLLGGVMPQRVVADWEKLHLINMRDVTATRTGVRVGAGAIANSGQFAQNPVAWVETTLIPAMQKAGFSRQQELTEIMRLFSRTTSQREVGIMSTQLLQIHKDYAQQLNALPTAQTVQQLYSGNFDQNVLNLQGSWNTLMSQLGTTILPTLVPIMQSLTKALQSLSDDVVAHPTLAKDLLLAGGALAAIGIAASGVLLPLGALRIALAGLGGIGGTGAGGMATSGAAAFGVEAGSTLAARLALSAGPLGVAIGAAMVAYVAGKALDDLISGSAGANKAPPRTGYHPNGLGGTLPNSGAPGSAEQDWLGNLWHDATTGTGGRTIGGRPLTPVITSPPPAAAPAATQATSSGPHGASSRGGDHHALTAAVRAGVEQGMAGATVEMNGDKVGAIVLNKINTSLRQPRKGTTSRDNRMAPSKPSQAVGNR